MTCQLLQSRKLLKDILRDADKNRSDRRKEVKIARGKDSKLDFCCTSQKVSIAGQTVVWKLMAQAKGSTYLPATFIRNANLLKGVASADLLEGITVLLHISLFADLALWESRRGKFGNAVRRRIRV